MIKKTILFTGITVLVILGAGLIKEKMNVSYAGQNKEETVFQIQEDVLRQDNEEAREGRYPIMGDSDIKWQQLADYFRASQKIYPSETLGKGGAPDIETFSRIYCEEAKAEGVRPEVAFAQTMKETGWLQYGGDASIEQFNFAGLGTTGGGVKGNTFCDVRTGVRAQIQHLKAYATDEELRGKCVDERYEYVSRGSAPYVEWLGQKENPDGTGWASGENYGYDIVRMIKQIR